MILGRPGVVDMNHAETLAGGLVLWISMPGITNFAKESNNPKSPLISYVLYLGARLPPASMWKSAPSPNLQPHTITGHISQVTSVFAKRHERGSLPPYRYRQFYYIRNRGEGGEKSNVWCFPLPLPFSDRFAKPCHPLLLSPLLPYR